MIANQTTSTGILIFPASQQLILPVIARPDNPVLITDNLIETFAIFFKVYSIETLKTIYEKANLTIMR
jgi:hypothetical protein